MADKLNKKTAELNISRLLVRIIEAQPEDATYEEIVRELAFTGMVVRS